MCLVPNLEFMQINTKSFKFCYNLNYPTQRMLSNYSHKQSIGYLNFDKARTELR